MHLQSLENTIFIGKVLFHPTSVGSTNDELKRKVKAAGLPEGTTVVTYHQTAGRGQMGSVWEGREGEQIALSVLLRPAFVMLSRRHQLNIAVSLAVHDVVSSLLPSGKRAYIKWPNDILIDDLKCCGILIENQISRDKLASCIVGIGLNVNQTAFPEELARATSLRLATGTPLDMDSVAATLLRAIERRYIALRQGKEREQLSDYYEAMYRFRMPTAFVRPDGARFEGYIQGIAAGGRLSVVKGDGTTETFGVKEIKFA